MKDLVFLFFLFSLFVCSVEANNLFRPFSTDNEHNLSLLEWTPVPFRVQYHGFVESSKLNRYIFVVNGEMVYLQPNEIAQQRFTLKQVLQNGQQVMVEDILTNELHLLNSGETAYIPGKFNCTLLDKKTGQSLGLSDTKNSYKMDNREILVSQKGPDLHIWEITKDQAPVLYVFPTNLSK